MGSPLTRILLASSPHYSDSMAVGAVIDALVQNAAGEIITLYLAHSGGACEIAYRLVHDQDHAGLEVHFWLGEDVDRVYVWGDGFEPIAAMLPFGPPTTVFGNLLSLDRA